MSSAYLKLFIFLPAILITVGCASSSLAFHTMNSAYILDILISQFGTSQLFYVPFLCCFLTFRQVSQEADQVVWYSHLLKNFPQFVVIHIVPLHLLKFFSRKFLNLFWNNFRLRGSYKKLKEYFYLFLTNFPTDNILHNHSTILQPGIWHWYNPWSLFRFQQFYIKFLCVSVCIEMKWNC